MTEKIDSKWLSLVTAPILGQPPWYTCFHFATRHMMKEPSIQHTYQNVFMDSARWAKFEPRDDDIIVYTSYKSSTTWTQMICALLVFQTSELPRPLGEISPWLDLRVAPLDEVLAKFHAQTHRRIIKTHTALEGLPYFKKVTYLSSSRR